MDYYILENSFKSGFDILDFNTFVDTKTKEAALRVSPSLVSLISYYGIYSNFPTIFILLYGQICICFEIKNIYIYTRVCHIENYEIIYFV